MKQCKHCGAQIDDDALFCTECGARSETPSVRTCPLCGAVIDADSIFCSECGTPVSSAPQQLVQESVYDSQPKQKNISSEEKCEEEDERNRRLRYLLFGIMGVVLLLAFGFYFFRDQVGYFAAVSNGEAIVADSITLNEVEESDSEDCEDSEDNEYKNGYQEEMPEGLFRYYQDGFWGVKNYTGRVLISPRYTQVSYVKPVHIGETPDGLYDIIDAGRLAFEQPATSYEIYEDRYMSVNMGIDTYLFFPSSGRKIGPITIWEKRDYKIVSRVKDGPLCFCNDSGTGYDQISNPIQIISTDNNEKWIASQTDEDSYTFYTTLGSSQFRMNGRRWLQLRSDYLQQSDTQDEFYDYTFTYSGKLTDIIRDIE